MTRKNDIVVASILWYNRVEWKQSVASNFQQTCLSYALVFVWISEWLWFVVSLRVVVVVVRLHLLVLVFRRPDPRLPAGVEESFPIGSDHAHASDGWLVKDNDVRLGMLAQLLKHTRISPPQTVPNKPSQNSGRTES